MKKISITLAIILAGCGIFILAFPALNSGEGVPQWRFEINALEAALDQYKKDFGDYPQGNSSAIAHALLGSNPKKQPYIEWRSGSADGFVLDPWGRPYLFSYEKAVPLIRSLGEDGKRTQDDKTNR